MNTTQELNKRERYKANLRPYDYYPQLQDLDFENLGDGDRFYLQDFGIFNVNFLEDEFTLRMRIPGGRIDLLQFLELSRIITYHDLDLIITARAGIQLHGLTSDNILNVFTQINELGLSTWQSFGDNVRNITTDIFDGCCSSGEIEVFDLMQQMQKFILKNPKYVGMLPRRISIGITGNRENLHSFYANDLCFLLAKKDGKFGFNVFMGGKNTEMARSADIFLHPNEVIDFYKAFLESFYKHGSRSSRAYSRLFYLIEKISMQAFKQLIETEHGKPFEEAGELLFKIRAHKEFHMLKDGTYAYRYETDFGRLNAHEIQKIAESAESQNAEIRLASDQNIYFLNISKDASLPKSAKQSATILACAGEGKCPYSIWSIKDECNLYLPLELIHKHQIQIGFSGCAKGCGRHRHTDIGLIGLKTNRYSARTGGVRIFMGAQYSSGAYVGEQLFSMVPFEVLHNVMETIILLFEASGYESFEEFSHILFQSYSLSFCALWILFNSRLHEIISFPDAQKNINEIQLLQESFYEAKTYVVTDDMDKSIEELTKMFWKKEGEDQIYSPPILRTVFR